MRPSAEGAAEVVNKYTEIDYTAAYDVFSSHLSIRDIMTAKVNVAVVGLVLLTAATGCRLIQTAADMPGQAVRAVSPSTREDKTADPVEVQQILMRVADEFASNAASGVDQLRRGTNRLDTAESLRWKLAFGTAACSIASGPSAIANLLDMTAFVTEARMAIEEHWLPQVYGPSALTLLDSCRTAETDVWLITATVLKANQQTALREAIELWHQQQPTPDGLPVLRAAGLVLDVAKSSQADRTSPGNILSVLLLDPLAGLDPTRREIAQARLFAARALFVAQKMPTLLRWQAELLSVETLAQAVPQQWTDSATQIAAAVERITHAVEQLPLQVAAEREAILDALQAQESALRPLMDDAFRTLAAGSQLATNLTVTLTAFDGVMERLGVGDDKEVAETRSEPFNIQNYGETATRLEAAARQLTELLQTFDQTLGANSRSQLATQIEPLLQQARVEGNVLVNILFWRSILLVAAILLAAVIYRLLAARIGRAAPDGTGRHGTKL